MNNIENVAPATAPARKYNLNHDDVVTAYRRYGKLYNLIYGASMEPGRRQALQLMQCKPGDRILEVGVGTGLSLPGYPKQTRVTAVDLSKDMLRQAKQVVARHNLTNVELHQMDAQKMSFPKNSFDKIAVMYVATVVPDVNAMLAELRRVCRPDGDVFILNHFASRKAVGRCIEHMLVPMAKWVGFDARLDMDLLIADSEMQLNSIAGVNAFGYWKLLHFCNRPPA